MVARFHKVENPSEDGRWSLVFDWCICVNCQAGDVVDIGLEAFRTTLNLLSNTIFSVDLVEPSSDTVQEFNELVRNMMEEAAKPNNGNSFWKHD